MHYVSWDYGRDIQERTAFARATRNIPGLIAYQVKELTRTAKEPFRSIMVYAIVIADWRVTPTQGRSLAMVVRGDSGWTLDKPEHASAFLIYRPDREGD